MPTLSTCAVAVFIAAIVVPTDPRNFNVDNIRVTKILVSWGAERGRSVGMEGKEETGLHHDMAVVFIPPPPPGFRDFEFHCDEGNGVQTRG